MNRYPLVAYVDEALTAKVRTIQQQLSDLTGSHACLDVWDPHISVGSEVWLKDDELDDYASELKAATANTPPFLVTIANFGFIDNWSGGKLPGNTPYGVFLDVVVTPELQHLVELIRPVCAARRQYFEMPWPYHPHITIAFKDLTQEGYEKAKQLFEKQPFSVRTAIDSFSIVRHNEVSDKNVEAVRISLTS